VTLVRKGLLGFPKQRVFRSKSFNLKYPTGERVPMEFKVRALIEVGELSIKLPVYVVDMKDDCLLGSDFLSATNFEGNLVSFFRLCSQEGKGASFCSRIVSEVNGVPEFLRELFEEETRDLNEEQREQFAKLLNEFQDISRTYFLKRSWLGIVRWWNILSR